MRDQAIEAVGQREDQVEVGYGEQLASALGQPGFLGTALTLRTVSIAAGVIDVTHPAAGLAVRPVSAQCACAASRDGSPDLGVCAAQCMLIQILGT